MSDIYQYNKIANEFSNIHEDGNKFSNIEYYKRLLPYIESKNILDVGCGDGSDMVLYTEHAKKVFGIDSSSELLSMAREKNPQAVISEGVFNSIPFDDCFFDVVLSKYALQTIQSFNDFYNETHRVLKKKGFLVFLTVHPLRQFFEKKTRSKNYFKQTEVASVLFNGELSVIEPTHTLQDYLSDSFLQKFELIDYFEKDDFYSAEKIGNNNYPTYLMIIARKRT